MSDSEHSADIDEDYRFQQRTWRAERLCWFVVLLILAGALAGLFSGGILGRAEAVGADGRFKVEYDRFARRKAPSSLEIRVDGDDIGGETTLRLSSSLLENFEIERIRPRPAREFSTTEGLHLVVRIEKGGVLEISGKASGSLIAAGDIAVGRHAPVRLLWFIWP